ncbi:vesicular glutamate transporter 3-like isoform X2 [Branchiostoma lanceolatum]|uniref:vesicular glutamate transporter 3-like isoform X2 n=1 Tax=Branchiostoma lanceolatum TaxID=7740 RepID=UPI003455172B
MKSPPKRTLVYSLLLVSFFISGGLYPSMQLGLSEAVTKWEIGEETPSSRAEIPSPAAHAQREKTEKTPWYMNFIRAFLETELGPDSRVSKRSTTKHEKHHVQNHVVKTSGKHEKKSHHHHENEEKSSEMESREEKSSIGLAVVQAMQDSENALHQFLRESLLTRSDEEIKEELNERVKKQDDGDWVQAMGIVHHLMFPIGQIFFAFPGGFVAAKGSAVKILGTMMFVSCLVHLFVPLPMTFRGSPHTGDVAVAVMMFLEGCCQGVTIPAAYGVLHRWAPKSERSTMVSLTLAMYYVGRLSGQFACAALKQAHGYMPAFYIYGPLGIIWSLVWVLSVKPNPSLDDNIDTSERDKINSGKNTAQDGSDIPMKEVLTDRNTVSYLATGLCFAWGMSVLLNHAPQYFAEKVALDVGKSPWLLWTLPLVMSGGMLAAGPGTDIAIYKGASATTTRKVVTGFVGASVFSFVLAMAFTKSQAYAYGGTVASMVMIGMAMGGGYGVTPLDASDRYSSIVVGIGVSLNTALFLVSPVAVMALSGPGGAGKRQVEAVSGWRIVHIVTAVVMGVAPMIYGAVTGEGEIFKGWEFKKPKLPKWLKRRK